MTINHQLPPVSRVGIVAKSHLKEAAAHLLEIATWLQARGVEAVFEVDTAALLTVGGARRVLDRRALVNAVDMVLVLGGDGTLLAVADRIAEAGASVPILGINFGSLGFLTEVTLPELYPALEAAVTGAAYIEDRLMLRSTTMRGGAAAAEQVVLNDVVVKGARPRIINLSVWVGSEFVTRVKADGLIVGTPTGSTAYNLAAGGPIVQPSVDALVLTPIAAHTLTNRPIVIPASSPVRIEPMMNERDEVLVTFDGQASFDLRPGDEVRICRTERPLRLLRPRSRSYFEVLRQKLKWGER